MLPIRLEKNVPFNFGRNDFKLEGLTFIFMLELKNFEFITSALWEKPDIGKNTFFLYNMPTCSFNLISKLKDKTRGASGIANFLLDAT